MPGTKTGQREERHIERMDALVYPPQDLPMTAIEARLLLRTGSSEYCTYLLRTVLCTVTVWSMYLQC